MDCVLELERVFLGQGDFLLKDINMSIYENDLVAIVGKSGAGKTTLLKAIGNSLVVDSGIIKYFGKEMYEDEKNIRRRMSVVFDESNFNTEMRAISLAKEIKRFEADFSMDDFTYYMEKFDLDINKRIRFYSKGMQRMYALVLALSRKPELLIMDEVTSGVDEESRKVLWSIIDEYRQKNSLTILFSTHHKDDIENINAKVITMDRGELV